MGTGAAAPHETKLTRTIPASTILATYDQSVGEAPYAGVVTSVSYTPEASVTGAASPASRSLTLINKGQAGAGATEVARLDLLGGVNMVGFDESELTLSATAGNRVVAAGDILAFASTPVGGTGLVDPGGLAQVTISRTAGT